VSTGVVFVREQLLTLDPAMLADPYPGYARLRAEAPAHRVRLPDGSTVWLVTRHTDVRALLADPRLSVDKRNASPGGWKGFSLPPALDANLGNLDPPDHARLRRLVSPAFSARRMEALRPAVRAVADGLLDAMAPAGAADLMTAYAGPLPVAVISDLLGVPAVDRGSFRDWTTALFAPETDDPAPLRAAVAQMLAFLVALIRAKRDAPADDLLSVLVGARDEHDRLTEDELVSMAFLILVAGYETSVHLIGNGVAALLRRPAQLAAVRADPGLLPAAVEEVLRFDGPAAAAIRRFPLVELEVGGVRIPAGDTVLLSVASAGRDPGRYPDPDTFDPARRDSPHLGFGHGIHFCLGAPLARLEGEVAIGALLGRFPDLALGVPAADLRWRPSFRVRGLRALPVTF
jgi:cytochrome P450